MRIAGKLAASWVPLTTLFVLLGLLTMSPIRAQAQLGSNAVCGSSPPSGVTCPSSTIDASAFAGTGGGTDVCAKINAVLTSSSYPASGAVVDARGIAVGSANTCSMNPFASVTKNSVVLLPPGVTWLCTTCTWVIPNQSRIVGEGHSQTTIYAGTSGFSGSDSNHAMIEMCNTGLCYGVGIADLTVNGNGQMAGTTPIIGILNQNSQELSFVDHVTISNVTGTGLFLGDSGAGSGNARNSGPYSNLWINSGSSATSATSCIEIQTRTRGIHGVTCTAEAGTSGSAAGIHLDANSNTLEDIHLEGVVDGILVGDTASASSNVLLNITGGPSGGGTGPIKNVIHISAAKPVSDLSILGVYNEGVSNDTIQDDVTSTDLTDTTIGMYALGEALAGGGYSRFSTSPNVPAWFVSGSSPSGTCVNGSLFSNKGGSSGSTLWVCISGGWIDIK
jgi:hypothetical protein